MMKAQSASCICDIDDDACGIQIPRATKPAVPAFMRMVTESTDASSNASTTHSRGESEKTESLQDLGSEDSTDHWRKETMHVISEAPIVLKQPVELRLRRNMSHLSVDTSKRSGSGKSGLGERINAKMHACEQRVQKMFNKLAKRGRP